MKKQTAFLLIVLFLMTLNWQKPELFKWGFWFPEKKELRGSKYYWRTNKNSIDHIQDLQTGDTAFLLDENQSFHWYVYSIKGAWEEQEPAKSKE